MPTNNTHIKYETFLSSLTPSHTRYPHATSPVALAFFRFSRLDTSRTSPHTTQVEYTVDSGHIGRKRPEHHYKPWNSFIHSFIPYMGMRAPNMEQCPGVRERNRDGLGRMLVVCVVLYMDCPFVICGFGTKTGSCFSLSSFRCFARAFAGPCLENVRFALCSHWE